MAVNEIGRMMILHCITNPGLGKSNEGFAPRQIDQRDRSHDMSNSNSPSDPLDFTRNLWGKMGFSLPSMVTPTFDVDELEKRLTDLKTVEGWLKMNLSMLQLTIQGLEMQCTTLKAVRGLSNIKAEPAATPPAKAASADEAKTADATPDPLQAAALWPWALMQQIQTQMQHATEQHVAALTPEEKTSPKAGKKTP
jgi:hypothetical protein